MERPPRWLDRLLGRKQPKPNPPKCPCHCHPSSSLSCLRGGAPSNLRPWLDIVIRPKSLSNQRGGAGGAAPRYLCFPPAQISPLRFAAAASLLRAHRLSAPRVRAHGVP